MTNLNDPIEDFRLGAIWGAASFPARLYDKVGNIIHQTGLSHNSKAAEDIGSGLIHTGELVKGIMSKMFWEAASAESEATKPYIIGKKVGSTVCGVVLASPVVGSAAYLLSRVL